jgi:hypothetical protein
MNDVSDPTPDWMKTRTPRSYNVSISCLKYTGSVSWPPKATSAGVSSDGISAKLTAETTGAFPRRTGNWDIAARGTWTTCLNKGVCKAVPKGKTWQTTWWASKVAMSGLVDSPTAQKTR